MNKIIVVFVFCLLAAGLGAYFLLGPAVDNPHDFDRVVVLDQPDPINAEFSLRDQFGRPFNAGRLKNRWSVLFFGYTHCPDVCPATMLFMQQAATQLAARGEKPQFVFVTVDPKRDTPAVLKKFIDFYKPESGSEFVAVTGDEREMLVFTDQLRVAYEIETGQGKNYTVQHTTSVFLVDPAARLRASILNPQSGTYLRRVIASVIGYYGG